jgi:hypothetical protein
MKAASHLRIWAFYFFLSPLIVSAALFDSDKIPLGSSEVKSPRLDFKGIPMGASEAVVKAKFPWLRCHKHSKKERASGDSTCEEPGNREMRKSTFAGISASLSFDFYADQLHRIGIIILANSFDSAVEALTAKYGMPSKVTTEKIKNQYGATVDNDTLLWRFEDSTIRMTRHGLVPMATGETLISNFSSIEYFTDFAGQEYERRSRPTQDKFKKDL